MSAIETGLYVAVGAADLAAEKARELPAVKIVVERTNKIRETSLIDQAREIEPKIRKQVPEALKELQTRGEKVVARIRKDAKEFNDKATKQVKEFPEQARKQIEELPETARKQVAELRENVQKRFGRETAKPAPKAKATASTSTPKAPAAKATSSN